MKKRGRPKKKSSERKRFVRSIRVSKIELEWIQRSFGTVQKFVNYNLFRSQEVNKP